MVNWMLREGARPPALVLRGPALAPLAAADLAPRRVELCGLHAAVIVKFTSAGLLSAHALFPTRFAHVGHPRGYLQAALRFDTVVQPTLICFDAVCLSFVADRGPAGTVAHDVFVSPAEPVVYCSFTHSLPQVDAQRVRKPLVSALPPQGNHCIWRHQVWLSPNTLLVKYTCLQSHPLSASYADLVLRKSLVNQWTSPVTLRCPDANISWMMHFAKIRAQECIFQSSKLSLVHSPAGHMFYCGVWCNDQAEYAAPALAYLGPPQSRPRKAAVNSLNVLANHFDYTTGSIPYSVEIDGDYIGRLDRGDAAMFAWGASLLVLTLADPNVTAELFPPISFACGLLYDKLNNSSYGVIPSKSDELEGRFPSGTHNLSTNCLAILAFEAAAQAAILAKDPFLRDEYRSAARTLRINTHSYFRCDDERRYMYYKDCKDARGWACLAALAELPDGEKALEYCLNQLWVQDGVLTSSHHSVVWDRTTLYAIRAAFRVGLVDLATERLNHYVKERLCHSPSAPFAVENNESWAQLSAESALLVRVVVEGLLGIEVLSKRRMLVRPKCPQTWPGYEVERIYFVDVCLTFRVQLTSGQVSVQVESADGGCQSAVDDGYLLLYVPSPPSSPEFTNLTNQQSSTARFLS